MEEEKTPKFSVEIKQSPKGEYYLGSLKVNADTIVEMEKLIDSALSSMIYKIGLLNESRRNAKKLQTEEPIILSDSDDKRLFEKLRQVRLDLAQEENIPAYMVFHDSTLKEIALRRPLTSEKLIQISGIGSVKYQKYGDILLKIVHEFTTSE